MRVVISLSYDERMALHELARRELRDPREQLRYLLRQAAHAQGVLPREPHSNGEEVLEENSKIATGRA